MELWLVAQAGSGRGRHVAIEAPSDAVLQDVVRALADFLGAPLASGGQPNALYCERLGAWLPNDQLLGTSGLRQGDLVAVAPRPPTAATRERERFDLVVTGGTLEGTRIALSRGAYVVGRGDGDDVRLDEGSVSVAHLRLRVTESGISVTDNGSTNGVRVGGERLASGVERAVTNGELIEVGRVPIVFEPHAAARSTGAEEVDGWVLFNRPPRRTAPFTPTRITIDAPPEAAARPRLPLATAVLPLLAGAVLYVVTKSPATLVFAALSPVMVVASTIENLRHGKRGFRRGAQTYRAALTEAAAGVARAHDEEAAARRAASPAPQDLTAMVAETRSSLWERRPADEDFLQARIGTATLPSTVEVTLEGGGSDDLRAEADSLLSAARQVADVPVLAPLQEGALGLSGPDEAVAQLARWVIVQAAALHSPRDLVLVAAMPETVLDEWSWLKWLPHARPGRGGEVRLGAGGRDAHRVVAAAQRLVEQRRASAAARGHAQGRFLPAVLVVLHGDAAPARDVIAQLLADGPAVGVTALWIGRDRDAVPGECRLLADLSDDGAALEFTQLVRNETVTAVRPEGLGARAARAAAQAIAPLRDPGAAAASGQIPDRLTLLETLGEGAFSEAELQRAWRAAPPGLRTTIGAAAPGPFSIDLRADGPHGLVGGTSGAGKSELLQSIVAGLAANYPPHQLSFLLVDYKGGAAFRDASELPHTVGVVTDLDEHLSRRALESLRAELRRRERILREHGAANLLELEELDVAAAPPSLVIVVDEFATLVSEIPGFVDGVVDVAQRGRSLGLHLLLATQRPRGAVNATILANTNLRIALRVTDASESVDIIDAPDAARIPRALPGRAIARTEQGELTEFQSALASSPMATGVHDERRVNVFPLAFGRPLRTQGEATPTASRTTQLSQLVRAAAKAAARSGYQPAPPPWLPALPALVPLDDTRLDSPRLDGFGAVLGLVDLPDEQQQRPLVVDFDRDGGMLVYGTSGSGKTTVLRTIAADLARRHTAAEAQIYGLDFAARDLTAIDVLPQCGGVVTADDPERVLRLLALLDAAAERRRREPGETARPRLVVLVDGYPNFVSAFERSAPEFIESLHRLLADGRPLGIHFVLTADRRGAVPAAVTGRLARKLVLRLADTEEYAALGVPRSLVQREVPNGRGFLDGNEVHVAVVGGSPSLASQADGLAAIAAAAARRSEARADQVASLPELVVRDSLPGASGVRIPFGIGESRMEPVMLDLDHRHCIVAGPRRSGRSTLLQTLALALIDQDTPPVVHVLAPRRSPLADIEGTTVASGVAACDAAAQKLAETLAVRSPSDPPVVLLVDDAEELSETAGANALLTIARRGRDADVRIVAAVERNAAHRAFGNWIRELRNEGHGLLLRPELDVDGELVGVRLPRGLRRAFPPGRGYLVDAGTVELVQVAAADEVRVTG